MSRDKWIKKMLYIYSHIWLKHTHIWLKDKLRHIKNLRVYLSKNQVNQVAPNWKYLEGLHPTDKSLRKDFSREKAEAK